MSTCCPALLAAPERTSPKAASASDGTVQLLAGDAARIVGFLALDRTTASSPMAGGSAAVGIAVASSVGAIRSFLSPTFIGRTRKAAGTFTGAVHASAALTLVAVDGAVAGAADPRDLNEEPAPAPLAAATPLTTSGTRGPQWTRDPRGSGQQRRGRMSLQ